MQDNDAETPRSNKTLYIVLGVVLSVLLLLVLICGGLFVVGSQMAAKYMQPAMTMLAEIQTIQATGSTFINDLSGDLDRAYNETSADFRKKMSKEDFHKFVDKHPELKKSTSVTNPRVNMSNQKPGQTTGIPDMSAVGTKATASYSVQDADGKLSNCTVDMVREESGWKIERVDYLNVRMPP